ncbi:MAG: hypothetical protein WBS33_16920 [Verrucomicrobiia bacterium]
MKMMLIALLVIATDRRKKAGHILCKDYTKAGFFSAKLVAEWKRTSAKCIKCITYTSTAESSGKLSDKKPESVLVLWLNHASCARHPLRRIGSGRMSNRKMNDRKKIANVPTGHKAI